jgi:IS1 family transposase
VRVLSREQQLRVLHLLVEGTSLRSVTRLTGVHRTTAMRLLVRAGRACRRLLDRRMVGLRLDHLECDEIWTFVLKKQAHLQGDEYQDETIGDQFLFVALDQTTKLIPAFRIGKRTAENTYDFMLELSKRLQGFGPAADPFAAVPFPDLRPRDADAWRPMVSTDGFVPYVGAVEEAFGGAADHGVIIKRYADGAEQTGRYAPPEVVATERRPITKDLDPYSICTSHVERHNLSIRTFLRRFTRLALGFSKKLANLDAAVALYVAHYNFVRWHGSIKRTPAMAAGVTGHPWTLEELMEAAHVH